jgi:hypothetical protein
MNRLLKRMKALSFSVIFMLFQSSCTQLVEVSSPANALDSKLLFSTKGGYEGAIRGVYQHMLMLNLGLTNGGLSLYMSLAADDLIPRSTSVNYQAFYQNNVLSSTSVVSDFWASSYEGIYRANVILESLENNGFLDRVSLDDFKGQVLFVRALYYFYLSQLFGDVPLILDTDYRRNATLPRTAQADVMQQVVADLEGASMLVKKRGYTDNAIPDYYAVLALLARVTLYTGDNTIAMDACDRILDEGGFVLEDLDRVFKTGSREVIWQLTNEYRNVAEARSFVPANATSVPLFYLAEDLLSLFEVQDARKLAWINVNQISGVSYHYPFKYQNRNNTPITEYYVVFRLAEIYLIRAEVRNREEDYNGAIEDLNAIRYRAGVEELNELNYAQINNYIAKERRKEFFTEWGHRWFDLKRWGQLESTLAEVKPEWQSHAVLLPIPFNQILRNVFLEQNPGYHE